MPGQVGRVDGGRIEVAFAIQSDDLELESEKRESLTREGECSRGWRCGCGGDNDDLKLSSRQGGDRATLLAACLSKAQGPSSDAALVAEGEWTLPGFTDRSIGFSKRC